MRILLTGACNFTEQQINEIRSLGFEVDFLQNEQDAVDCSVYDGVVCNGLFLYHSIENFTNLKFVQLTSAGYDRVPMDYIKEHGITIYNACGVYSIPMAEYVLAGVLDLYKQIRFFGENQKRKRWQKHRGLVELSGKNVCIVGCGSVGGECAKRFKVFGCMVIGVDIIEANRPYFDEIYGLYDIATALGIADVVVITLPLTEHTHHLFNGSMFDYIKKDAVFVNISRGAVVDTSALIEALKCERLSGAVLDVFENEPLDESSELWSLENVFISPHNSFVGDGNQNRLFELIKKNLRGGEICE